MQHESPLIDFQNVSRSFDGRTQVLDGVSFAVQREEVVALLGRNGAGKSTLIHLAMGMLRPQRGRVLAFGVSPFEHPVVVRRRIGYVGDQQALPPRASISELIALHRRLFPTWDVTLERELCARFGIRDKDAKIATLSKGQVQQVALLCAVSHRPELLLLDEPAGALDPAARREFLETSLQLLNREGTSILFSSHHMGDVERLGGRAVLIDEGTVRVDADLDALRERHCLAVIPQHGVSGRGIIERLPGCLRVRQVRDTWHGVFTETPDAVSALLRDALGLHHIQCATLPLEELFIELVGGKQALEAA